VVAANKAARIRSDGAREAEARVREHSVKEQGHVANVVQITSHRAFEASKGVTTPAGHAGAVKAHTAAALVAEKGGYSELARQHRAAADAHATAVGKMRAAEREAVQKRDTEGARRSVAMAKEHLSSMRSHQKEAKRGERVKAWVMGG
jgi:hypothetical protein